jgi:hypothetical protein
MPGYFISFDDEGEPSSDSKLTTRERFSQLEILLVSLSVSNLNNKGFFKIFQIAYGPGIQPEKDDKTIETSTEPSPPSYWAATATSNTESHTGSN